MIARGIVLQTEHSLEVEPGVVTLNDQSRHRNNGAMSNQTWAQLPSGLWYIVNDWASNGHIIMPYDPSLNPLLFTYEVWVDIYTLATAESYHQLGNQSTSAPNTGWYLAVLPTGDAYLTATDAGGTNRSAYTAAGTIVEGTWYHIVGRCDGARIKVYIDGVERGDAACIGHDINPTEDFTIGDRGDGYGSAKANFILFRLYNYALTPSQINQNYENSKHLFGVFD